MTVQIDSSSMNSTMPPSPQPTNGQTLLSDIEELKRRQAIVTWAHDEYKKCKSSRTTVERQWYKNLAFYLGNQWVVQAVSGVDTLSGKLFVPKAPPWRTRLTVNRIKPIIRTELARVTSQKPNASVVPASSEDEDLFAAQAGEQVWESLYSSALVHRKFSRSAWWMLITGVGFTKQWWDPEGVDKLSNVKGKICYENVTPFHIFVPDLLEAELEDQLYVIHAYTLPMNKARQAYPDIFNDKSTPNVVSSNEIMDEAYMRISANEAKPDSVLCLEIWLKPGAHPDYPEGGLITVVDTALVQDIKGMPYDHGEFPFTKYEHVPTGKFYTDSIIVDLIDSQREYNRTRSQIIEAKNRMAKPQLMAPIGSVVASKITSEPGQVIEYKPGFAPPQPLPLQPIPSYVLQELDRIILDMEDISAQHQVSKGNVPSGVTAATAISYLQERDDSVLTHTYNSVEQGMEKTAKQFLTLVVQYWDIPHLVKVTGTDGAFDAMNIKGADIESGTDIRMESGSALPISKAARQSFIMDMMKMGFIPPDQGLRIMDIGGVQKLYDQLQVDERQAQRENLRMKTLTEQEIAAYEQQVQVMLEQQSQAAFAQNVPPELADVMLPGGQGGQQQMPPDMSQGMPPDQMGGPPANDPTVGAPTDPNLQDQQSGMPLEPPTLVPVNTWDNHAIHIEVHNRFRKGQAFEMLSDAHKQIFEAHVQMHAMALNQSAMNAQMQTGMGGDMGVPPMSQSEGGLPMTDNGQGGQQGPPPSMGGPNG